MSSVFRLTRFLSRRVFAEFFPDDASHFIPDDESHGRFLPSARDEHELRDNPDNQSDEYAGRREMVVSDQVMILRREH